MKWKQIMMILPLVGMIHKYQRLLTFITMPETETELNATETETDTTAVAQDVQSELMDMIIADESPANISDKIKDMLFAKSAAKVDSFRPEVAADTFNEPEVDDAIANAAAEISGEAAAERAAPAEE